MYLCVCVCVCYTRTHAQTAEPIVSKFCMSIEGHLVGNIGPVSCAWVNWGLRERRRKGGGVSFLHREFEEERDCEIEKLRIQILVTALIFCVCFFLSIFRFSRLELVNFRKNNEENIKTLHLKFYIYQRKHNV